MSEPRWERLQRLFHEALERSPEDRARFLDHACAGDDALRAEVARLLAASERAGPFISTPALAAPAADGQDPQAGRRVGVYRLLRQVGRGGMGAVYLAERDDGAFAQRVAIKLIKRGMDTDQVLGRFRAERQILASLDHPNIARLLDGGTTGDGLPYFAMEYIEGQPIDRFAESHRLGVEDRLRLFLQVCDAVSSAHAQGVVHRDIKPLNTLVTDAGVPKLLDFGIAKVLHDAGTGEPTTVTGLRLLTPDYASPEQIEGRAATAASDVYSLGVVLYELLTGRSPYRIGGRTPHEIAAAVGSAEPERPSLVVTQPAAATTVRRTVPATGSDAADPAGARRLSRRLRGDLDTIVLTAMRKEPERRYPTAQALADDLRRHLDGRPIAARGDGAGYRVGKFARRHRAVLLAAAAAVVLTAAGLALFRPRSDSASLLSAQALALRDRIVVADFADQAGDPTLAAAVTEAFRTDLAQSPLVRVLTPRQVRTALATMQQSPDVALDDSLARELALREGVKAIVTGSVARLPGRYSIRVDLVGARSGDALATVQETAADTTGIVAAVDRASKSLRRRIGESLGELAQMPRLERATTPSLPALRLFTEGQQLMLQGKRTDAVARFEQAVAIDSGFAGAHLGLSMAYGSMADEGRSFEAGRRALSHGDRLPFLERNILRGSRAFASQDYPGAIRAYTELLGRFPDHIGAINNLALAYRESRQFAVAESLFRAGARQDTSIANLLFGLHSTQILQGRFDAAAATLDTLARRFPGHPVYPTEAMQDAAARQDWDRAAQIAWKHIEVLGADTLQLVDPYEALAQIAMLRGQLAESERLWAIHGRLSRAAGVMSRHLFGTLQQGYLLLRYRGDTAAALALVDGALRATPMDSLLPADRRYDEVARFRLAAGRRAGVAALLARAAANDSALHRVSGPDRLWTRGMLALAEGRTAEAVSSLERAAETHVCPSCVLPDLGRAYERAGRDGDAAATYRRYRATPWLWRYEPDAVDLPWVLRRQAALAERVGDTASARAADRELVALWRQADPVLAPVVAAARQRLGTEPAPDKGVPPG